MNEKKDRTAVLLLNHGAADSQPGVRVFLDNIFQDIDIIRLPGGTRFQGPFARLLSKYRAPRVERLYEYMGGGSPLLSYMRAQADALRVRLNQPDGQFVGEVGEVGADGRGEEIEVFLGLRYYSPSIADGLGEAVKRKVRRVVVFPQYPQHSVTTVDSVLRQLARAVAQTPGADQLALSIVPAFGAEPAYVDLMAAKVREAIARAPTSARLLFTAHSVPMKFVDEGDVYPETCQEQAALIAAKAGVNQFDLAYQSRSGPVEWLGPDLPAHVEKLLATGEKHFVLVPLSFVQDHLETLVELDVQLAAGILRAGGSLTRVRTANNAPEFADLCATLVRRELAQPLSGTSGTAQIFGNLQVE